MRQALANLLEFPHHKHVDGPGTNASVVGQPGRRQHLDDLRVTPSEPFTFVGEVREIGTDKPAMPVAGQPVERQYLGVAEPVERPASDAENCTGLTRTDLDTISPSIGRGTRLAGEQGDAQTDCDHPRRFAPSGWRLVLRCVDDHSMRPLSCSRSRRRIFGYSLTKAFSPPVIHQRRSNSTNLTNLMSSPSERNATADKPASGRLSAPSRHRALDGLGFDGYRQVVLRSASGRGGLQRGSLNTRLMRELVF